MQLTRLDGEVNRFAFAPQGDYLRGDGVVHEPHSFSVVVEARRRSQSHRWTFDSFEGRTTIPAATAEAAGVRTEIAGPATIAETLTLTRPHRAECRTDARRYQPVSRARSAR